MRRVNAVAAAAAVAIGLFAGPARADVTAFEGARLIVGDGSVVENATLVIDGNKIVQAGQGVARARRRHARQSRRQDRDAGDHRHPCPSRARRAKS